MCSSTVQRLVSVQQCSPKVHIVCEGTARDTCSQWSLVRPAQLTAVIHSLTGQNMLVFSCSNIQLGSQCLKEFKYVRITGGGLIKAMYAYVYRNII